ncbi:N-acetylmuramoyl-L-alanine amidase [Sneathiella glossodoripedis]|uniref:N-acetylmuramoyl-L-alanine amidase n=1 Tax=Sneathiella glossodoripedis TaxID=418853 RepID=UPI00047254F7|nr:N-acetylmuramoyl-L-alanine amidase [Sneathiella glossodoripedis]
MSAQKIVQNLSPNHSERKGEGKISMLVLHYTGMKTGKAALERLCDPAAEVSAHYLVEEDGSILQLVEEDRRAWHAGVGFWNGETDINSCSIGIEIVNPGHEFGYVSFPKSQILSTLELCQQIVEKYEISPLNVVGHSDVAPQRKQDPGEQFPWQWFAKKGVGYWPDKIVVPNMSNFDMAKALSKIGYDVSNLEKSIEAFQRHWRPQAITGKADAETCRLVASVAVARQGLT